jgi:hypothetical protein
MKRGFLFFSFFLLSVLAWFGFNRAFLPAPPEIVRQVSAGVSFSFSINRMDLSEVELALNGASGESALFPHFSMSNEWTKGRPGLVLNAMGTTSRFGNRGKRPDDYLKEIGNGSGKDFSAFMKDNSGKAVKSYTFRQALSEDKDGKMYMKMSYAGRPMPLIQSLTIKQSTAVPRPVSAKFTNKGQIYFLPGTVYLDRKINGFWIPVEIRK